MARYNIDFECYRYHSNWAECLSTLLSPVVGMDPHLVWNTFGMEKLWKNLAGSFKVGEEMKSASTPDPLEHLYDM